MRSDLGGELLCVNSKFEKLKNCFDEKIDRVSSTCSSRNWDKIERVKREDDFSLKMFFNFSNFEFGCTRNWVAKI